MASKVEFKKNGQIEISTLDGCYAKELAAKEQSVKKYGDYKKSFTQVLKMVGASGAIPMTDADYKKLADADNLKKLVKEMYDMQYKAQNCTLDIAYVTSNIDQLVSKDAEAATEIALKFVNEAIKEVEKEIEVRKGELVELTKKKTAMAESVKLVLKSETKDIFDKLLALKNDVPAYKSGKPDFEFNMHHKYLKAKTK